MWLEFITALVNIRFSNAASISRQTRDCCYLRTRHSRTRHQCSRKTSLQLRLCTRESRNPRHRGLSVSNGEMRTLGTIKFFELLDALASLQPRETLHQSSDLAALLQQFAPTVPLAHDFPCLLLFFRSRRTLLRSTCTWFVHTRCNIVTCLEYHNILTPFHYVCLRKFTVRTQSIFRIYWKTVLVQDRGHEILSIYYQ